MPSPLLLPVAAFGRVTLLLRAGLLLFVLALPRPALAGADEDFLGAREAFRTGARSQLDALAPKLRQHVLYPYVAYYQLRLRLEEAPEAEITGFLDAWRDTVVADRLRSDWLKLLGERGEWGRLRVEYPKLQSGDAELTCYERRARLATEGEAILQEARSLWFTGREMPDACTPLFEALVASGALSWDDVWERVRLALAAGRTSLARAVNAYFAPGDGFSTKALQLAADKPEQFLKRYGAKTESRGSRELTLFALQRQARVSPQLAADYWTRIERHFPVEDRQYGWQRLAYQAALTHQPETLDWFRRAGDLSGEDMLLAWKARAALRQDDWDTLAEAIGQMSPSAQEEPAWQYWKARALKRAGKVADANALLADISRQFNFYGQLAAHELGTMAAAAPPSGYRPPENEVKAMEKLPALQRALAFYRLELRFEGMREWNWGVRGMEDRQLLAAAELARRNQLWDRAIYSAERTRELHDFSLRFLTPYRQTLAALARDMNLDEAWVYGLIRQESRFMPGARSSAGAMGLMQLMPATARWVAKRMGMNPYRQGMVEEIETNLTMGMYYLKHVSSRLEGHPVLASAAYNAGPSRAQRWRDMKPLEGAVYAETIPFTETRDYVKKVMSNTEYYAGLLGQPWRSMGQRLGTVPGKAGAQEALPEDEN